MRARVAIALVLALAIWMAPLAASGPIGFYGIVERVVFEPNEAAAERIRVWGVFSFVDGTSSHPDGVSKPSRGFLYFRLPPAAVSKPDDITLARREWNDLKQVAGTGAVVGFGRWGYAGRFNPASQASEGPYVIEYNERGNVATRDLRVRPASETAPENATVYQTNAGVVKLTANGSQAAIVKELQAALRK